jgi:hypothetical protein
MRLQVTDLFFRPLFAFFNTLVEVAEGDSCECVKADGLASRSCCVVHSINLTLFHPIAPSINRNDLCMMQEPVEKGCC